MRTRKRKDLSFFPAQVEPGDGKKRQVEDDANDDGQEGGEAAGEASVGDTVRIKAVLAYDGTDFAGFQSQPHGRTIQDAIERKLGGFLRAPVRVTPSGRTDGGVHARAQVLHFDVPASFFAPLQAPPQAPCQQLRRIFQNVDSFPRAIQIVSIERAPPGFHARESCSFKRYLYRLHQGRASPFEARFNWSLPERTRLDVAAMQQACQCLRGVHDFSGFGVMQPDDGRHPVRHMRRLEVLQDPDDSNKVTILAECDRFLYKMMRMVSGALVQVGLGKVTEQRLRELLETGNRCTGSKNAVFTAPPQGLTLDHVYY